MGMSLDEYGGRYCGLSGGRAARQNGEAFDRLEAGS